MKPLLMVHGISSNARRTFGVPQGLLYELSQELSFKAIHRNLPFNPRVQELVVQALQ